MALYHKSDGYPVNTVSFSALQDFKKCPKSFYWKRVEGWREKTDNASQYFGNAIEATIEMYHTLGASAVDTFVKLWAVHEANTSIHYTDKEDSWANLNQIGQEMMALYQGSWKNFGYSSPKFQRSYRKEVSPDSYLAGIESISYLDMIADFHDPASGEDYQVQIDIKTASALLAGGGESLKLSGQLRHYAWKTGIMDCALLRLVKNSPNTKAFKRGDEVQEIATGRKYVILAFEDSDYWWKNYPITIEKIESKYKISYDRQSLTVLTKKRADEEVVAIREHVRKVEEPQPSCVYLLDKPAYEELMVSLKDLSGKVFDEGILAAKKSALKRLTSEVTKQRIQFIKTRLEIPSVESVGQDIVYHVQQIVSCDEQNHWPAKADFGEFNSTCGMCQLKALCLGNKEEAEKNLEKISRGAKIEEVTEEETWL